VIDRLLERIVIDDAGCWLWLGALKANGYGQITTGSKRDGSQTKRYTHRVAYEHFRGPIAEGLTIDHLCRVRRCANPWHLEPVTHAENCARGDGGSNNRGRAWGRSLRP